MALRVQLQRLRKVNVRNFAERESGGPFSIIEIGSDQGGTVEMFIAELVDLDFLQDAINQARAFLSSPEVRAEAVA